MTQPDIDKLRQETPACLERIHLNNAGASLMPARVLSTIQEYLILECRIGGYEAADHSANTIEAAYQAVAQLIGAKPKNIAFVENATAAYIQALSSVPFRPGDVLLTTRNDYASNQIQFLKLKSRLHVDVIHAPDSPAGGVNVAAMGDLIRKHRPQLVCVTHVPTSSGIVQDVRSIGKICRDEDVLYLVDACQSVGQISVDVKEIGCDFLSCTSRKFLRGPRGVGFLYAADSVFERGLEPMYLDMQGADWIGIDAYQSRADAKRFENWEFPWALILGMGEAARYATEVGIDWVEHRVRKLASQLRAELNAIHGIRVLEQGANPCGIIGVAVDNWQPAQLVKALRERRINTSSQIREYATLYYDDQRTTGALRISPHYYNTEGEIGTVAAAIRDLKLS